MTGQNRGAEELQIGVGGAGLPKLESEGEAGAAIS
jgi:hypothetical protein